MKIGLLFILVILGLSSCGSSFEPQGYETSEKAAREALSHKSYHATLTYFQQGLPFAQNGQDSANLYYLAHYASLQLTDYISAATFLHLSLLTESSDTQKAKTYSALVHCYNELGMYDQAYKIGIEALSRSTQWNEPELIDNYLRTSTLLASIETKNLTQAREIIQDLSNSSYLSEVSQLKLVNNMLFYHVLTRNYDEVIHQGNQFVNAISEKAPLQDQFWFFINLSTAYNHQNQFDKALLFLERAESIFPESPTISYGHLFLEQNQGNNEEALFWANHLINLPFEDLQGKDYQAVSAAYRIKSQILGMQLRSESLAETNAMAQAFEQKIGRSLISQGQHIAETYNNIQQNVAVHTAASQQRNQHRSQKRLHNTVLILIALLGLAMVLSLWRMRVLSKRRVLPQDIVDRTNELARILQLDDPRDS